MKTPEVRLINPNTGALSRLYYSPYTDPQVVRWLENLEMTRQRCRIWIGDTDRPDFEEIHGHKPDAGLVWDDEYGVVGTIGKSTGFKPIPLMIHNSRSYGGGAILTDCIVRIKYTNGYDAYKHPNYHNDLDTAKVVVSELAPEYSHAVVPEVGQYAGQEIARFHSEKSAKNYLAFMQGKRMCK